MTHTLILSQPATTHDQYAAGRTDGEHDAANDLDAAVTRARALDVPAYASDWTSGYVTAVYTASLRRAYPKPE